MAQNAANGPDRPLGCQARPWLQSLGREVFVARLASVAEDIAAVGFTGFETALACLPLDDPSGFAERCEKAGGIQLSGAHAGGRWWDASAPAAVDELAEQTTRLPAFGCRRLVLSTGALPHPLTDEQLDAYAANIARLASLCRSRAGVRIALHNHAAELADDARVIAALLDRCPEGDVGLGADLGWVAHAGADVIGFIERFGSRLDYLHVRDVTADGFTEVGRGTLDHARILGALDAVGYSGWLVAESELGDLWHGETDPVTTARTQYAGLRRFV